MNAHQRGDEAGQPAELKAPTPSEFLTFLDREIDYAHRQARRPGWTPWALLSALAALLWGLATRVDRASSSWIVFQAAALAMMAIEALRRGRLVLDPSRGLDDDEGRVLVSSDLLDIQRPALVLELIYSVILLWGIAHYTNGLASWTAATPLLWAVLMGLSAVVGLLYSAWPVPFPVGLPLTFLVWSLIQGLPLLVPVAGAVTYAKGIVGHGAEDIQVGLLVGSAAMVLLELAREPNEPPLVVELVELRRTISLGSLAVTEGVQRATTILRGLKLEEYVQQDARRMLRALEALRSAITDFRPVVVEINRQANQLESGSAPDGQAWASLLAAWERKGDQAMARAKRVERWQSRYARRLAFASAVAQFWHLPYEGELIVTEIRPKVATVMAEYAEVIERYRAALSRLEEALRSSGLIA